MDRLTQAIESGDEEEISKVDRELDELLAKHYKRDGIEQVSS